MRVLLAVACLALLPAHGAAASAKGFELILLDGYEDCPLAYRDLDLDTYGGDSDVRIVCGPPPTGFVAIGGDCNDANAAINPGATETEPDLQFADENCDGVDGNATLAIFVAPTGSTAANCGARALPCSLPVAFARAQGAGRSQVYLQHGDYAGSLRLEVPAGNLALFGGYDGQWRRANRNTNPSRILGATDGAIGAFGVQVAAGTYRLVDLLVESPSASQTPGPTGSGLGSYAVRAVNGATLTLTRVTVTAGNGAGGQVGNNGQNASQVQAESGHAGGNGDEFNTVCDNSSRGAGGSAGTNGSCTTGSNPNGGNGGDGGTMDTNCNILNLNLTARPGVAGIDAVVPVGTNGQGGAGGSGGDICGPTANGTSGTISDGFAGGSPSNSRGRLAGAGNNTAWTGTIGNGGGLGQNGTGGGGGGGAGGCDAGVDSYGAGGGGGGAGGCRAAVAGGGGPAGGASVGVFVAFATLTVQDSLLVRGVGGNGGSGGNGGLGQPGGAAGPVGTHPGGAIAGLGGAGGRGGHSGAGSGGAGGISAGIFNFQSTVVIGANTSFSGGTAGSGGAGGSTPIPGIPGPDGSVSTQFFCIAFDNC